MAYINDLWDGSIDKRKVRSLVPYCGQDGDRAQVPQHPIDSYIYISNIYLMHEDFLLLKSPYMYLTVLS